MKPATLVTPTGRPAVVTDTVSSPSFGMSGRMPATIRPGSWHTRRPLISRGSGPAGGAGKSGSRFPAPTPTQKSRITGDEDTP
jgi:hypothetical protein